MNKPSGYLIKEYLRQATEHGKQVAPLAQRQIEASEQRDRITVVELAKRSEYHQEQYDKFMRLARSSGATDKQLLNVAGECFPGSYPKSYVETAEKFLFPKEIIAQNK